MTVEIRDIKSYIHKAISGGFMLKIMGLGLGVLSQIILARTYPQDELGSYFFLISISAFVIAISTFGMNKASLKFIPLKINKNINNLEWIIKYFSKRIVTAGGVIGLIFIMAVWMIGNEKLPQITIVGVASFIVICMSSSATEFYTGVIQGYKKIALSIVPTYVVKPVLIIIGVGLLWISDIPAGYTSILIINGVASILVLGLIMRFYRKIKTKSTINKFENISEKKELILLGVGFQGILICNIFLTQTDSVMIGLLLGAGEVASYVIALKVANLLTFFLTITNTVAAPIISKLYADDELEKLKVVIRYICRIVFLVTGVTALVIIMYAEDILGIFGDVYKESAIILKILCLGAFVNSITGPASYLLSLTGHQKEVLGILLMSVALNILMNYLLISSLGLIGAAISTCITTVIWNLSLFLIVKMKLGITSFL